MKAALISIGDELLIGQTINTNAAWLGRELALLGIPVARRFTVGDAEAEIRLILARCVADEEPLKIGSELRAFAERFGGVDLPITRDGSPIEPADFG